MKKIFKTKFWLVVTIIITTASVSAQQLVLPGDHPDPSVVKIGDTYWASATTSNWLPAYPLLKSKDLVNWENVGHVFDENPDWVDYYFWAPEISHENGKTYIYYSAHKRDGNLCVGVASADRPEGPYKDHGPLICQEAGSIDAFPIRDTDGKLYLIWKEDGNSVGEPTPNWIQEMNEERTALIGEKKELFRNDAPWEGNLIEGISIIRHKNYLYAFYAGAGCCGSRCSYQGGVARATTLLGTWEKFDKNPNLTDTEEWVCPGHGTPVEMDGKFYFLYHAYNSKSHQYVGRQGMLIEFEFTPDGWIHFIESEKPNVQAPKKIIDNFKDEKLSNLWQWSVFQKFEKKIKGGKLHISSLPDPTGAFLGQRTYSLNYDVLITLLPNKSTADGGLAIIGDEKNTVSALYDGKNILLQKVQKGNIEVLDIFPVKLKRKVFLKMQVRNGKDVNFFYSYNNKEYFELNKKSIDAAYLPPWDRGIRVGIVAKGAKNKTAVFDNFVLLNVVEE